jgi:hypothetical protein
MAGVEGLDRTQLRPQWRSLADLLMPAVNGVSPTPIALVADRLRERAGVSAAKRQHPEML